MGYAYGMAAERYWVRASPGEAEKGPYDVALVKQSFDRGLLTPNAVARDENGETTRTLRELFEAKDLARAKEVAKLSEEDFERNYQREASKKRGGLYVGLGMIGLGIVLTFATYSAASESGGGRYIVFTGLFVVGIVRVIRSL